MYEQKYIMPITELFLSIYMRNKHRMYSYQNGMFIYRSRACSLKNTEAYKLGVMNNNNCGIILFCC